MRKILKQVSKKETIVPMDENHETLAPVKESTIHIYSSGVHLIYSSEHHLARADDFQIRKEVPDDTVCRTQVNSEFPLQSFAMIVRTYETSYFLGPSKVTTLPLLIVEPRKSKLSPPAG